jgi:hypothetical protein
MDFFHPNLDEILQKDEKTIKIKIKMLAGLDWC